MHRAAHFLILSLCKFIPTSFPLYSLSFYFLLFSTMPSLSMRAREGNYFSVQLHPSLISSTKEFFNRLMRFNDHRLACTGLKNHAMQEKSEASGNSFRGEMLIIVLKDVRDSLLFKAMAPFMCWSKGYSREGFSWLQLVMRAEHLGCLLDQSDGFFSYSIVVAHFCALSFW